MRMITGAVLTISCLASLTMAQDKDREMTCDENWQSDRVSHCEINEMSIAAASRLSVDGGVNGGMRVRGWSKSQILVRARVQTSAGTDAEARGLARQIIIHTGGGRILADGPGNGPNQ